ncbi:MAG: homoserine dehydrogenase [Spirochaetae bacterium HGW-Spirochaetae-10]|nr:MAG: homoserine dehydrogenase [Spirochaetae bacterium HGW-Spirochaetae-10]
MKEIGIGLLGAGTVGRGLIEILETEGERIASRTGVRPVLRRVADRSFQKKPVLSAYAPTASIDEVIDDASVELVVELMGGLDPAGTAILKALRAGKSVVTANKALIAARSAEIFEAIAEGRKKNPATTIGFEAAVGGALPLVRNMRLIWSAGGMQRMVGILNGTCNFIITRMQDDGMEYAEALKLAQQKGFAEADPSFDVSGKDAAQKLAILSMLAFDVAVRDSDIVVEGIESFHRVDHELARKMGRVIRLLAIARRVDDRLLLRVHPAMIPANHLLADVRDEFNALFIEERYAGPSLIVGRGAGALPTAAAVLSDLVAIGSGSANRWVGDLQPLKSLEDARYRFYFRFRTVDRPGVLARIAGVLAEHDISIATMHQEEGREPVDVVIVTHEASESAVRSAVSKIDGGEIILAPTVVIRMEDNPDASL